MMSIQYRINVLQSLKEQGYNTGYIQKNHIFTGQVVQAIRERRMVKSESLSKICEMLNCRIEELIIYVPEGSDYIEHDSLYQLRENDKSLSEHIRHIYAYLSNDPRIRTSLSPNDLLFWLRKYHQYLCETSTESVVMTEEEIKTSFDICIEANELFENEVPITRRKYYYEMLEDINLAYPIGLKQILSDFFNDYDNKTVNTY